MSESWKGKFLWELLEMEAPEKFYVGGSEHPAFLYFPRQSWASRDGKHTLYMNGVGLIATFTSRKKALERLKAIVESAYFPVRLHRVSRIGRNKGKRIMFAENMVERVDKATLKGPMKVFEIEEWKNV